ncbi:MAG: hypothetical protein ACOX7F_06135 [Eubacteriales bacterium]
MDEKQAWEQFWNSGRVEDYLRYHQLEQHMQEEQTEPPRPRPAEAML